MRVCTRARGSAQVYVHHMCAGTQRGQRTPEPWELASQAVVSSLMHSQAEHSAVSSESIRWNYFPLYYSEGYKWVFILQIQISFI